MRRLLFTQITLDDLVGLVELHDHGVRRDPWTGLSRGDLTETQQRIIDDVTAGLEVFQPTLVNEATVWSRAIFPLLLLAEGNGVQVQADVPLAARIGDVELAGSADGAFGTPLAGALRAPFVIVVEAKRGIEHLTQQRQGTPRELSRSLNIAASLFSRCSQNSA